MFRLTVIIAVLMAAVLFAARDEAERAFADPGSISWESVDAVLQKGIDEDTHESITRRLSDGYSDSRAFAEGVQQEVTGVVD